MNRPIAPSSLDHLFLAQLVRLSDSAGNFRSISQQSPSTPSQPILRRPTSGGRHTNEAACNVDRQTGTATWGVWTAGLAGRPLAWQRHRSGRRPLLTYVRDGASEASAASAANGNLAAGKSRIASILLCVAACPHVTESAVRIHLTVRTYGGNANISYPKSIRSCLSLTNSRNSCSVIILLRLASS